MGIREIIFRGKRTDNGEWETGSLVVIWPGTSMEAVFITDKSTGYQTQVDPSTVGQYTGLTDKNGKRIFEGDILLPSKGSLQIHLLVVFLDFSWQMVLPSQKYYRHRLEVKDNGIYEVIGNIYDNPELLGEKE